MKINSSQIERLVRVVIERLKDKGLIQFKIPEKQVFDRAIQLVMDDFKKEDDLHVEVNKILDDLEKQNPGGFDRRKMFSMVKIKLAKQKGIVL